MRRTDAEKDVGRFKVEVELANNDDLAAVRRGDLDADKVRRLKVLGVVDAGAARLVLPESAAKKLGLQSADKVQVRYANGETAKRPRLEGVYLELQGRHGLFSATVEPTRDSALIGFIVLDDLDLLVDSTKGRVYPRDPDFVVSDIG